MLKVILGLVLWDTFVGIVLSRLFPLGILFSFAYAGQSALIVHTLVWFLLAVGIPLLMSQRSQTFRYIGRINLAFFGLAVLITLIRVVLH